MLNTLLWVFVISVTTTAAAAVWELKRKRKLEAELAARGIQIDRNPSALLLPPRRYRFSRAPQWAAMVPGRQLVQLYGYGAVVIAAWRSGVQRQGAIVVASESDGTPEGMRPVPRKNVPVASVDVFSNSPSLTRWIVASSVLPVFEQRRANRRGFRFDYVDGACYLNAGYSGGFSSLDDITETIAQLERAMIDWRLAQVA